MELLASNQTNPNEAVIYFKPFLIVNVSAIVLYLMAVILLLVVTKFPKMDKNAYTNITIYTFSFSIKATASIIMILDKNTKDHGNHFENL